MCADSLDYTGAAMQAVVAYAGSCTIHMRCCDMYLPSLSLLLPLLPRLRAMRTQRRMFALCSAPKICHERYKVHDLQAGCTIGPVHAVHGRLHRVPGATGVCRLAGAHMHPCSDMLSL